MNDSKYEIVIGLEVHIHLKTETKLFCRCKNSFGGEPNTQICPVCTGQPGVLPVTNIKAIEQAVKASLALDCTVNERSVFARKQYFYPDLPKNYQVSQYELPLAEKGKLSLSDTTINITRAHMEEDAGKLIHDQGDYSMVDYNRTGTPLLEIVSEPEIDTPQRAAEYLKVIRQILKYCGVSDCDMEKGSMRCDANISLRETGETELGVKTEVKNMNSFKSVEKALEYEAKRQEKLLEEGEKIVQETRLWDENKNMTFSMRSKEEAHDYRYFPEPDLPALMVEKELIDQIKNTIPELPLARKERYIANPYGLSEYDANVLTQEKEVADYFEEAVKMLSAAEPEKIKKLTNWITGELLGKTNSENIQFSDQPIKPEYTAQLVEFIEDGTISGKMAKDVFKTMWETGKPPLDIIEEKGLKQITSGKEIEGICQKVIEDNTGLVEKYLSGKEGVIGALVGNVMKETRGQANPKLVNEILRKLLDKKRE
ncbi:Asp-tRNA(Asn)/Glu-tRNA(Gln) amidotransferase subunit GatB [Elusimicrobiota bacterium]